MTFSNDILDQLASMGAEVFKATDRVPAQSKKELIQYLMGRRQVLTSYVSKHKRDRIAGKHVIAYLERKETEELAVVQATLDKLTKGSI